MSYLAHQREMTFEDGFFLRDEKVPFTTQFAISLFGLKSNMWNKYIIFLEFTISEALKFNSITYDSMYCICCDVELHRAMV